MQQHSRAIAVLCPVFALVPLGSSAALADISGFTQGTYSYNQADAGTPAVVGANSIQMTTGGFQNRSIWFNQRQSINQFAARFTYRQDYLDSFAAFNGFAFVLSNSAAGTSALGTFDDSSGYAGITPSAAVTFHTALGSSSLGFYRNGNVTSGDVSTGAVQFSSRRNIIVDIVYDGTLLSVSMADGALTFGPQTYLVGSLASTLGSSTAYIGFTAQTSSGNPGNHYLSGFTYTVPSPTSAALLALGGAVGLRRRRR